LHLISSTCRPQSTIHGPVVRLHDFMTSPVAPSADDTLRFPPPAIVPVEQGDPPLPPGYLHLGVIGRGGTAVVYRARELATNEDVAIKVIPMTSRTQASQVERELRLAMALVHPSIVRIKLVISSDVAPGCVMELVDGPTFSNVVRKLDGQNTSLLTLDRVCANVGLDLAKVRPDIVAAAVAPSPYFRLVAAWMIDLCSAVRAAHEAGMVHGDIKPHNLLLAPDASLKLADFGAAAMADGSSLGVRYGTPRYLAPERLADLASRGSARTTDRRVDIWGIGVCMYELLTMRPAFAATSIADALRAVATTDPLPPRQINWAIPSGLELICLRCLRREPNERFADAGAVAVALREYLDRRTPAAGRVPGWLSQILSRLGVSKAVGTP